MGGNDGAPNKEDPRHWISAIASRRDRAAFAALFGFYAPRIKSMLMRMGATADAGEDLAQETMLAIWRKATYYDPGRASALAWVYTIARNLRIDLLRREKLAALYATDAPVAAEEPDRPDALFNAAQCSERISTALDQLPAEQVRVVKLSFFEGRAHSDIAALLDLPVGTVKSRLRLGMERLRKLLGDLK